MNPTHYNLTAKSAIRYYMRNMILTDEQVNKICENKETLHKAMEMYMDYVERCKQYTNKHRYIAYLTMENLNSRNELGIRFQERTWNSKLIPKNEIGIFTHI